MNKTLWTGRRLGSALLCCTIVILYGCGGGGTGGNSFDANNCNTLNGQVAYAPGSGDLVGTAVSNSGNDCNQYGIYSDANNPDELKQVAISNKGVFLFNGNGDLVAVRGSDGDTATFSQGVEGRTRVQLNDSNGTPKAAGNLTVNRQTAGARRPLVETRSLTDMCGSGGQLESFRNVTRSFDESCDGSENEPSFCTGTVRNAVRSAVDLCPETEAEEMPVEEIVNDDVSDTPEAVTLTVVGYATTREAAGGGTTIVLTAEIFGGTGNASGTWEQTDGPNTLLTGLPGNAAIADATITQGTLIFTITATDEAGNTATDDVEVILGSGRVLISVTNPTPDVGDSVTFTAVGQDLPSDATYFWSLGEGSTSTDTSVTITYPANCQYPVQVWVTDATGAVGDISDTMMIVVGDGMGTGCDVSGATQSDVVDENGNKVEGDFVVKINIGDPEYFGVDESRMISAEVFGAVGNVYFGWGIVDGPGDIWDTETAMFAYSATPTLAAYGEGIITVGVVVVDDAGRFAQTTRPVPVFGSEGGLYAAILGPFVINVGQPVLLDSFVIGAQGDLTYEWFIEEGSGDVTLRSPRDRSTELEAGVPGSILVGLGVGDGVNYTTAYFWIEVMGEGGACVEGDYWCEDFCEDGSYDSDCDLCGQDGICVSNCWPEDVDCYSTGSANDEICWATGYCCPGDSYCDTVLPDGSSCPEPDSDCEVSGGSNDEMCTNTGYCCAGDGICDFGCPTPDEDCGTNEDICAEAGFCCVGDYYCDEGCPTPDPDCGEGPGTNEQICADTGYCCPDDGWCDEDCPKPDSDCGGSNDEMCMNTGYCCAGDGYCDFCPEPDPDCGTDECVQDAFCNIDCLYNGIPDSDCTNDDVCVLTDYYWCCPGDGWCDDPYCPTSDVDCTSCVSDGMCIEGCVPDPDPDCGESPSDCSTDGTCNTTCISLESGVLDSDCTNADVCSVLSYCCEGDTFCDPGCPTDDTDCIENCSTVASCDTGGNDCILAECVDGACQYSWLCCGDGTCDSDYEVGSCPEDCGA